MMKFGDDLNGISQKRLAGLLVLMSSEVSDGEEICERLLDAPNAEMDNKPLRWATDLATKTKCGVGSSDIYTTLTRILKDGVDTAAQKTVATVAHALGQLSNTEVKVGNLRLDSFDYGGKPGCYAWLWDLKPPVPSKQLICTECNIAFDFAGEAGMVADGALTELFRAAGRPVFQSPSKSQRTMKDMLQQSVPSEHRGVPEAILNSLRSGTRRRWWCMMCRTEYGYPGSFFLP